MARAAWRIGSGGWGRRRLVGASGASGPPSAGAAAEALQEEDECDDNEDNDNAEPADGPRGPPHLGVAEADGHRMLAALDTALDALALAAFVIARNGRILRANALARAMLAREAGAIRRSLAGAMARGATSARWALTPLRGVGDTLGFLVIHRPPSREIAIADALRTASHRWKLTARQLEVLELTARGLTNDVIAETLRIGKGTVEFHLSAIFDKAGVCNRATLIVRMYEFE
jgi:DNA-binding CsgD family transcriptional regulator